MQAEKERLKNSRDNNYRKDLMYINDSNKVLSALEIKEFQSLWDKYEKARKKFEENFNIYTGQVTTFKEQLKYLISAKNTISKEKKYTMENIAEAVGISPNTLRNYDGGRKSPSMNVVIAICIVLELDIKQATALLSSLGICFLGTSRAHYAYMYLLEYYKGKNLSECNEILRGLHIDEKDLLHSRKYRSNQKTFRINLKTSILV